MGVGVIQSNTRCCDDCDMEFIKTYLGKFFSVKSCGNFTFDRL